MMCAYKLVTCYFKWFGLQAIVEDIIQKVCGACSHAHIPACSHSHMLLNLLGKLREFIWLEMAHFSMYMYVKMKLLLVQVLLCGFPALS